MGESREWEEGNQKHNLELNMGEALESRSTTASLKEDYHLADLTEFLDLDDRPTLILDLKSTPSAALIYYNASLGGLKHREVDVGRNIVETFGRYPQDVADTPFLEWAKSTMELFPSITYDDVRWTSKTIRHRWRIITGTMEFSSINGRRQSISLDPPRLPRQSTAPIQPRMPITSYPAHRSFDAQLEAFRSHKVRNITTYPPLQKTGVVSGYEPLGRFDMTGPNPNLPITSFMEFFKAFDWDNTGVGPIKQWSPVLRRMCNFMMLDPRPASIYYGKDKTTIYNESYVMVTGHRHPFMLGKPFQEAWPEVQESFLPEFDKAAATGKAFVSDNSRFYIERHGYIEETYYSISLCPFDLEDGEIAFYNPIFDTTRQVIADRRMDVLLRVGQKLGESRDVQGFWDQLLVGLEGENPDVPFALIYSASGDADVDNTLSVSSEYGSLYHQWDLEGSINVPELVTRGFGHFGLDQGDIEEFLPNFEVLIRSTLPTLIQLEDGSMPTLLSYDITIMDVTQKCDGAVFLPIRSTGDKVLGFLIVGINPRKRYDDDYVNFIELLNRQLETSMASILLLEEQRRSAKLLAQEADREKNALAKKIEAQKQEAFEIESRFRRMADLAPVGMFHIDVDGVIIYANKDWYDLTQLHEDSKGPKSWYKAFGPDQHSIIDKEWARLTAGENANFELRLKKPFITGEIVGGEKVEGSAWIIAAAYAEKDMNGKVVGVLGCITDISRQKWAEGFQNRRKHEAIELKRTQESFMDMISHEMRNPLSAIIQSADWIATNISSFTSPESTATMSELVDTYADTVQTIILCADHTTRIINDVLTLSKLDSDLLAITPVETQPIITVSTALKMFREEAVKKNIDFEFNVEQSYLDLAIDWVKMDPSRLLQVLINLTTNAIKFTHPEAIRKISISLGASLEPALAGSGIHYLPRAENNRDMSEGADWGEGQTVYIYVSVQDTGRGLSFEEIGLLFKRFSQSSPKTHVQYGGSGLGLFISRRLTELQGGQIGVASEVGVGSTFAFFVKARRCTPAARPTLSRTPSSPSNIHEQKRNTADKPLFPIQNGSSPGSATAAENIVPIVPESNFAFPKPSTIGAKAISKHVLVVEDNIVNQRILAKQLRSAGCTVHVANHGEEALTFLETSQCWESKADTGVPLSVVLMDLEMPVMDGLTCVKVIRKLQTEGKITCHLPVVAVTANARTEQIQVAKAAGMDGVVTKPFRIREIMPVIDKWCLAVENASSIGLE